MKLCRALQHIRTGAVERERERENEILFEGIKYDTEKGHCLVIEKPIVHFIKKYFK